MLNCTKVGGRSSAIRAGSRLEGLADNAQGRSSSCPGGFPGLEEDSYLKLRSDLLREFKSMSALFQRCQPAPEVGLESSRQTNSKPTNRHDLISIHAKLTSAMCQQSYFCCKSSCTTRTIPLFQGCHINDIPVMDLTIKNVLIRVSDIINPNHFNLGFNMIFSRKIKHFLG